MLCSECNKNPAILFYKKIENGKESLEGYCYDCAKKKGINPTEVLHDQNNILSNDKININDMTKQFETIFKDLAENINLEDIENLDGAITFESQEQNPDSDEPSKISGAAIPLGSIFSNMFSNKASKSNSDESEELNDGRRKVKVEKKKNKKSEGSGKEFPLIFLSRKKPLHAQGFSFCGRWDLNPHDRNDHQILSLACLPIPALPHVL